jgi:hypothetical protein
VDGVKEEQKLLFKDEHLRLPFSGRASTALLAPPQRALEEPLRRIAADVHSGRAVDATTPPVSFVEPPMFGLPLTVDEAQLPEEHGTRWVPVVVEGSLRCMDVWGPSGSPPDVPRGLSGKEKFSALWEHHYGAPPSTTGHHARHEAKGGDALAAMIAFDERPASARLASDLQRTVRAKLLSWPTILPLVSWTSMFGIYGGAARGGRACAREMRVHIGKPVEVDGLWGETLQCFTAQGRQ